jgi:plastocyanin
MALGLVTMLFFSSFALSACAPKTEPSHPPAAEQLKLTTATIDIKNFAFDPATLEIKVNTAVEWVNGDTTTHDITGDTENWSWFDFDLEPGESTTFFFETPGVYDYHCDIHPSMKGTIIVK